MPLRTPSKSTLENQACFLISLIPFLPQPKRFEGWRTCKTKEHDAINHSFLAYGLLQDQGLSTWQQHWYAHEHQWTMLNQHQSDELFARVISQPRRENNVPFADVAVYSRVTVRRVFERVSSAEHLVNEHAYAGQGKSMYQRGVQSGLGYFYDRCARTKCPHVNALSVTPAVDDLWSHVLRGAAEGVRAALHNFCHAKVNHFEDTFVTEQEILRLEVAVQDVEAENESIMVRNIFHSDGFRNTNLCSLSSIWATQHA